MTDKEFDDEEQGSPADRDEPIAPLLSFDSDTAGMPHWADAPTGEIPVFEEESAAESGGSRLFPQLPDDPNLVDTTDMSRFDAVRSDTLPTLPRDPGSDDPEGSVFAPPGGGALDPLSTGPIDLGGPDDTGTTPPPVVSEPAAPVADTTVIRGLGESADPGAVFDRDPASDARDEELRAATALGGGRIPDFDARPTDISGSASLEPPEEQADSEGPPATPGDDYTPLFDEQADDPWARLDSLPDLDGDDDIDFGRGQAAPGFDDGATLTPPPAVEQFPSAPDVTVLFDDDAPAVAAPLGSADSEVEAETPAEPDKLDSWADLDAPAPHWREGSQDYEERSAVTDDERTVLHLGEDHQPVDEGGGRSSDRNVPVAVAVGVALAAAFFGLLKVGPGAAMGMVVVALVLAAAEFFQSVRHVGYRPAALLGLASVGCLALATYWKGFEAYPIVLGLTVITGLMWFLFGVEGEHATANLAITLMGVGWIGVLGSFAALTLKLPNGDAVLIGAVLGTVAYDVGGYVIGRTTGQSRLAPHISPNKTYEGLIGGMILAVVVTTLVLNSVPGVYPWTVSMTDALWLGVAIAVTAPLGDLTQSLVKRDLGVKDMGSLLPGHGGVFDRFDSLLFVLPAAYYVADLVLY
jgi:CDP-diglyceride synthetase